MLYSYWFSESYCIRSATKFKKWNQTKIESVQKHLFNMSPLRSADSKILSSES